MTGHRPAIIKRPPQHLVTLLTRAGTAWRAYEDNISGTTCPLGDQYPYASRHDPFVYFDDVTAHGNPRAATCISHIRPYTELASALWQNTSRATMSSCRTCAMTVMMPAPR